LFTLGTKSNKANIYFLIFAGGGASTLKTRKGNLPKTIRNAIDLVDQLGIQHLWVDCLCIIQDDTDSKHDQIQAMSGIYANAYVTIIAGNGWDANHGLRGIQGVTEPRQLSTYLKSDFQENLQPYSSIWYSRGWVISSEFLLGDKRNLLTAESLRPSRR
jgi:hypothetical protein